MGDSVWKQSNWFQSSAGTSKNKVNKLCYGDEYLLLTQATSWIN